MSEKIIIMRTPAMINESYLKDFIARAFELGHIPSTDEFQYGEENNSPETIQENTTLLALSYTATLHTEQHDQLWQMVPERIRKYFEFFKEDTVLHIFEEHFSNAE